MLKFLRIIVRQARLIGRLGLLQFLRITMAPRDKAVSIKLNENSILIRRGTPDLSVAMSCFDGEFEPVRHLLPRDYSGTIVDAGGYIGTAAIALSQIFPEANILTIEPAQENFNILQENVKNYNNITPIFGALASQENESVELVNRGTGEWGFTLIKNSATKAGNSVINKIPTYTLKSITSGYPPTGLIKMDIEGGELDLLKNDSKSLDKIPIIFIELHDRIVNGCTKEFMAFSKKRLVIKSGGEKFLSISRDVYKS